MHLLENTYNSFLFRCVSRIKMLQEKIVGLRKNTCNQQGYVGKDCFMLLISM